MCENNERRVCAVMFVVILSAVVIGGDIYISTSGYIEITIQQKIIISIIACLYVVFGVIPCGCCIDHGKCWNKEDQMEASPEITSRGRRNPAMTNPLYCGSNTCTVIGRSSNGETSHLIGQPPSYDNINTLTDRINEQLSTPYLMPSESSNFQTEILLPSLYGGSPPSYNGLTPIFDAPPPAYEAPSISDPPSYDDVVSDNQNNIQGQG